MDNFALTSMELGMGCAKPRKMEPVTAAELRDFIQRIT